MTATADQIARDEIFELLSSSRRRHLLVYLMDHPDGATLQEISRDIAARELDISVEKVSQKQEKRIYVSLYQTHIPKLSEAGVIKRKGDDVFVLDHRAGDITEYLNNPDVEQRRWDRYYLVVAAISAVLFFFVTFDVLIFAAIADQVIVVGILFGLSLMTAIHIGSQTDVPGNSNSTRG